MVDVDFGGIGDILGEVMDTDRMDIGRRQSAVDMDGFATETDPRMPFYIDVPCHLDFPSQRQGAGIQNDMFPVSGEPCVHCALSVDIRQGDALTVRRLSKSGTVLETYTGYAGLPAVDMARRRVPLTQDAVSP